MIIVLIWILNFIISWVNAWGCGRSWAETKINGGIAHFMNWMGAIMSASGFTWCYLILVAFFGGNISIEHEVAGKIVNEPYLSGEVLSAFMNLGYIVIIFPILGSGIAILIDSWARAYRQRTIADIGVAGWNTFAMAHNIYSAVENVPKATKGLWDFFDGEDNKKGIIILLVLLCLVGGVLTTRWIILTTMKRVQAVRNV